MPAPPVPTVVVVGSANMDLVAQVAHLPAPGETVLAGGNAHVPGGKGANAAVAAARLGAQVTFVGRVGRDDWGRTLRAALRADGVRTTPLRADPTQPTGVALITVDAAGQNQIVVVPGANGAVSLQDVDRVAWGAARPFSPARRTHRGLLVSLEVPLATITYAVQRAHAAGWLVMLNPAPAQPLPPALLAAVDVLTPNTHEAAALLDRPIHGVDDALRAAGDLARQLAPGGAVVITLGAAGAVLAAGDVRLHQPAFPVTVVDTTAAGDTFSAALLVARLRSGGDDRDGWPGALAEACAAGALTASRPGAQPAVPTAHEVRAFLAARR